MTSARHHTACSADGCRARISKGWFCKDHWFALPEALRVAVLAAYSAARKGHCRTLASEQERLNRAYGAAFRDCTDHLRRAPRTPAPAMSTTAIDGEGQAVRYVGGRML